MISSSLTIRPFFPSDQKSAQQLILAGLADHFGALDPAYNQDLHDIMASYINQGNQFVVAELAGEIVGTGGLIAEEINNGRIVRVSVHKQMRRRGIARHIVNHLIIIARQCGYQQLLVETNHDWCDALGLYQKMGFVEYDREPEEVHMRLNL